MRTRVQKHMDWFWIILVNFMWATQVPVIKLIGSRLSPVTIAFLPVILSTLIFLPAFWYEKRTAKIQLHWRWADAKHFLLAGFVGCFVLQLSTTLGAQRTSAANAGVITLSIPVLVAVAASFILKERLSSVRILSFGLALLGVLVTSLPDFQQVDFRHSRYLIGNLLFLSGCAASAFFNTYCKLLVDRGYTELEILIYTSIVGSLASIPLFVSVKSVDWSMLSRGNSFALWGILELGVIVCGLSMLLWFRVLRRMDVTQAILGTYLLPLFIGLLAVLLLGESITPLTLTGGALILVSTLMITVYEEDLLHWLGRHQTEKT